MLNFFISLLLSFLIPYISVAFVYLSMAYLRHKLKYSESIWAAILPIISIFFVIYFLALAESYWLYLLAKFNFSYTYIFTWLTVPLFTGFFYRFEFVSQKMNVFLAEIAQIKELLLFYTKEEVGEIIIEKHIKNIRMIAAVYAVAVALLFSIVFFWEGLQKFLLFFV